MKRFLILIIVICMAFLLYVGAQEKDIKEEAPIPSVEPDTRLDVTLLDGVNNKLIELENCKVFITGKLQIVNDSFNYTKTFTEGDRYDITISIRPKK